MIRVWRAAVEVALWIGVLGALALFLVWWDLRPAADAVASAPDEELARRAAIYGSFLLVTSGTALVLWLREEWRLAQVAAFFTGAALFAASAPWSDIDGAYAVVWALRVAAICLWVLGLVAGPGVWGSPVAGERPARAVVAAALAVAVIAFGYGCALVILGLDTGFMQADHEGREGWRIGLPGLGLIALCLPALRHGIRALRRAGDHVSGVT